jgi:radical SAM enzyme (TIGR01210 family)
MHYPEPAAEREAWILAQRPARNELDPLRPSACLVEKERSASGEVVTVATIFLTGRECPWRCLMCDLWRNTLPGDTPLGSIPAQIEYALSQLPSARQIKLYNSGSFFDPRAIPIADYPAIAKLLTRYDRVIVECHPALIGGNCLRFRELIAGRLEVAMGIEKVHPEILPQLNKGMTLEQFSAAANALRRNAIDLRAFILVKPPFLGEQEGVYWAERSLDFAFSCGTAAASLIPTRGFAPPRIETLEASQEYGLRLQAGRVFADLWDLEKFAVCANCYAARHNRLREMNLRQVIPCTVDCDACGVRP